MRNCPPKHLSRGSVRREGTLLVPRGRDATWSSAHQESTRCCGSAGFRWWLRWRHLGGVARILFNTQSAAGKQVAASPLGPEPLLAAGCCCRGLEFASSSCCGALPAPGCRPQVGASGSRVSVLEGMAVLCSLT